MLALTRKIGERLFIGDDIEVKVVKIDRGQVMLGIVAPKSVRIDREEIASPNHPRMQRGSNADASR